MAEQNSSAGVPAPSRDPLPPESSKPRRVLACVSCQQRKVKCNRKFPCSNCIKSQSQCVPATLATRRRRRQVPELLERLHKYEDLLRQNNIDFEALSENMSGERRSGSRQLGPQNGYDSDDGEIDADRSSLAATIKSDVVYETKSIWRVLNSASQDHEYDSDSSLEVINEVTIKKAWEGLYETDDHLLFGSRNSAVELSTLHPEPAQIFRLWQIYLDNVNPLLKVTHTPSLQGRIVEALSNVSDIDPTMEALMFSIYCIALASLVEDDVQTLFTSSKKELLSRYHFGSQQALLNCGFLRSTNRDCLTALYLYLVSVRGVTVPRSLSAMLSVAINIAERMGIHNEAELAKLSVLEAEMCRRLWWSLMLFDARTSEMAGNKTTKLAPTWDCKIPLNVNDSDLRPEMKVPPEVQDKPTEALFAVIFGELGEFVRNTMFYLDFAAPYLKPIAKDVQNGLNPNGGELVALSKIIEGNYLKSCDLENPLHFMTIWMARGLLAKYCLMEHNAKYSSSSEYPEHQTEARRDTAVSFAITRLDCDTKLMTSPLIKGFHWFLQLYFPFPAYIQLAQEFKRRPIGGQAERAWAAMDDNYNARLNTQYRNQRDDNIFFRIFAKIILQSWEVREAAFSQLGEQFTTPRFVTTFRQLLREETPNILNEQTEQQEGETVTGVDDFMMSVPMDFGSQMYMERPASYAGMGPRSIPQMPVGAIDPSQLNWAAMNWTSAQAGPYSRMPGHASFPPDVNQADQTGGLGFGRWSLDR